MNIIIKGNKRNPNIQALRGVCALMVFFSHILNVTDISFIHFLKESPVHFFFDGQIAVIVFFALSGFYYYSENTLTYEKYFNGVRKKVSKIYPPHIAVLLLGWVVLTLYNKLDIHACDVTAWFSKFWRTDVSLKEFFGNALVLLPHNSDAINPPTWYLIYEVRMIFLIPLLVFICNKTSWRLAYIIICLSYIIDITFMIYVGIYIAGSLLHRYMKKYKSFRRQYSYMIFVLLILLAISFLNIRNLLNSNHIYIYELFYIIQTIGALIIIYLLNTNTIIRIPKVLEFMGNISYEFYISHFVIILILAPWIEGGFILMITSLFISICVSLLMHKYMIIRL